MSPRRASTLFVLLLFLAWAPSVSAETAWILWLEDLGMENRAEPRPLSAHETRAECEAAKASNIKFFEEQLEAWVFHGEAIILGDETFTYSCWPDTIDLRGPKK